MSGHRGIFGPKGMLAFAQRLPGDHPNFRKNALGVKRPFSELSESRAKETIYLHRSGPLLENGLDRPKNRYGRCGFPSFTAFPYLP